MVYLVYAYHDIHYGGFIFVEVPDIFQQILLCFYFDELGFIYVFETLTSVIWK